MTDQRELSKGPDEVWAWVVKRDGSVVDRKTGSVCGTVKRLCAERWQATTTDRLTLGESSTRLRAAESLWSFWHKTERVAPEWEADERRFRYEWGDRGGVNHDRPMLYGFPAGMNPNPDPRDFMPDLDCATEREREAWVHACRQAEAGENVDTSGNDHLYGFDDDGRLNAHISRTMWGLGTYWYDEIPVSHD